MQRCPCFLELQGALQKLCKSSASPAFINWGWRSFASLRKFFTAVLAASKGCLRHCLSGKLRVFLPKHRMQPYHLCHTVNLESSGPHRVIDLGLTANSLHLQSDRNTEGQVQESGCYCNSFLLVPLASCMLPTRLAAWSDEGNVTLQVLFGVVWSIIKARVFCLLHLVTTMNSETSCSRFRQEWYPELLSEFAAWMYLKWTSGSVPHFFLTRDGSATEVPAQHFDLETHALFYCFDKTTCHSRTGLVFKIAPRK